MSSRYLEELEDPGRRRSPLPLNQARWKPLSVPPLPNVGKHRRRTQPTQPLRCATSQRDHGASGRHEARDTRPGNRVPVRGPANDDPGSPPSIPSLLRSSGGQCAGCADNPRRRGQGGANPPETSWNGISHVRHTNVIPAARQGRRIVRRGARPPSTRTSRPDRLRPALGRDPEIRPRGQTPSGLKPLRCDDPTSGFGRRAAARKVRTHQRWPSGHPLSGSQPAAPALPLTEAPRSQGPR